MVQKDKAGRSRTVHYMRPCSVVWAHEEWGNLLCSKHYLAVTCEECLENRQAIIKRSAKRSGITPGLNLMLWVFLIVMPCLFVGAFFSEFLEKTWSWAGLVLLLLMLAVGLVEAFMPGISRPLATRFLVKRFNEFL